jgi:hypothetical protein
MSPYVTMTYHDIPWPSADGWQDQSQGKDFAREELIDSFKLRQKSRYLVPHPTNEVFRWRQEEMWFKCGDDWCSMGINPLLMVI